MRNVHGGGGHGLGVLCAAGGVGEPRLARPDNPLVVAHIGHELRRVERRAAHSDCQLCSREQRFNRHVMRTQIARGVIKIDVILIILLYNVVVVVVVVVLDFISFPSTIDILVVLVAVGEGGVVFTKLFNPVDKVAMIFRGRDLVLAVLFLVDVDPFDGACVMVVIIMANMLLLLLLVMMIGVVVLVVAVEVVMTVAVVLITVVVMAVKCIEEATAAQACIHIAVGEAHVQSVANSQGSVGDAVGVGASRACGRRRGEAWALVAASHRR